MLLVVLFVPVRIVLAVRVRARLAILLVDDRFPLVLDRCKTRKPRNGSVKNQPAQILTIAAHATGETLLQPAVLAPVPVVLRHLAVHRAAALVAELFADRPLEEALAALAADRAIVATGGPIATHQTELDAHAAVLELVLMVLGGLAGQGRLVAFVVVQGMKIAATARLLFIMVTVTPRHSSSRRLPRKPPWQRCKVLSTVTQ
uniref:Secreted protein n=1 Tax=Anopheles coluzzii TaxID=1518534 RepID=A0A8W7PEH8_ANOCL